MLDGSSPAVRQRIKSRALEAIRVALIGQHSRNQVSDVWVAGKRLLNQRQLTTIELDKVIADARQWGQRIANG